jgi:sulfate adenylyltransferase
MSTIAPNSPHGGVLVDLLLTGDALVQLKKESIHYKNYMLNQRQLCDAELLLNGGFSPLRGFMNEGDYKRVVEDMRLENGLIFPIPIYLDVSEQFAATVQVGEKLALRDTEGSLIAVLTIESIYTPDKPREAEKVLGSPDDIKHPFIDYLLNEAGARYIGGSLQGAQLPTYYDFNELRLTPKEVREKMVKMSWTKVVFFQTRNPMHRSHRELTLRAAKQANANLWVQPVVGMTKPGDVDHYTRVRCYKELMNYYPPGMATLSVLPLAMRMAGPKEAIFHSIIRKNYGATDFIIGRDHAGPGDNRDGKPFYGPYDAQELTKKYEEELGIKFHMFNMVVFVEDIKDYRTTDEVEPGMRVLNISGTELRRRLYTGIEIPDWFSFPSVVAILRQTYPPRTKQGFTVFLTGLSGGGKSTIANALRIRLMEEGSRPVTLLDGDEIRTHLSTELTFSKEHRNLNIKRICYVATQITKSRGIAIVSAIAPYNESRTYGRHLISKHGGYYEVHVSTSIEVCEQRDVKGLYAKARSGIVKGFTGIDDPYETPINPEFIIDTNVLTVKQAVSQIILKLEQDGYLGVFNMV